MANCSNQNKKCAKSCVKLVKMAKIKTNRPSAAKIAEWCRGLEARNYDLTAIP